MKTIHQRREICEEIVLTEQTVENLVLEYLQEILGFTGRITEEGKLERWYEEYHGSPTSLYTAPTALQVAAWEMKKQLQAEIQKRKEK